MSLFNTTPYVPQPVMVFVAGWEGERNGPLEEKLTELIEQHTLNITNLITGDEPDASGQCRQPMQSHNEPVLTLPEFDGRQVQRLLFEWLHDHPGLKVNLLFVEPSRDYQEAVYAWLFRGMKPTSTGSNQASRLSVLDAGRNLCSNGLVRPDAFVYEIQFGAAHAVNYGFVKAKEAAFALANTRLSWINRDDQERKVMLEREQFEPQADNGERALMDTAPVGGMAGHVFGVNKGSSTSALDTSSPAPHPNDTAARPNHVNKGHNQQRRSSDRKR